MFVLYVVIGCMCCLFQVPQNIFFMQCIVSTDVHVGHDQMDANQEGEFDLPEKEADKSVLHPAIKEELYEYGPV